MIFKGDSGQGDLNGFLDAGSHIEGELHFEDTFRVDGKVKGRVVSTGDLVVGERGEVEGEIDVGRIFVSGTVRGSVKAATRVEVTVGGKLHADIDTPSLVIEDGAFFEGRCSMVPRGAAKTGEAAANVARMPLTKEGKS